MNNQILDKKFATWKGIPREEIEWYPTVNKDKCTGCGMCMTGCTSCQVWCIYDAISFPDPGYVKNLIKKRGVLKQAKQPLKEKIPT